MKCFVQAVLTEEEHKALQRVKNPVIDRILSTAQDFKSAHGFSHGVVVFDYDNTLVHYSDSLDKLGEIKEGAREAVELAKSLGFRVGICTGRPDSQANRIFFQMVREKLPVDFVQEDPEEDPESVKPRADIYIDDRAFRHTGDWKVDLPVLKEFFLAIKETIDENPS